MQILLPILIRFQLLNQMNEYEFMMNKINFVDVFQNFKTAFSLCFSRHICNRYPIIKHKETIVIYVLRLSAIAFRRRWVVFF